MTEKGRVLITGASGFVGGFLVDEAISRGLTVDAAVRKSSNTQYLSNPKINFVYINFDDKKDLRSILSKGQYDYIIHNAGLTRSVDPQKLFDVNAGSIETFDNAIQNSGIPLQKFTFVSSLAAYGPADFTENGIVQESSEPHPVTNYGKSKLAGERILKKSSLPYTIIRPTAVYGPREQDLMALYQTINKGLEVQIGLSPQTLTFIYVKDLVRAIVDITLEKSTLRKSYFITDTNTYSSKELNEIVRKVLNKKTLKLKVPIPVISLVAFVVENISKLRGGFPPLNKEKVKELGARSWKCDVDPLQKDIKFAPKYNLKNGLEETIPWYKENNLL